MTLLERGESIDMKKIIEHHKKFSMIEIVGY